LQQRNYRK